MVCVFKLSVGGMLLLLPDRENGMGTRGRFWFPRLEPSPPLGHKACSLTDIVRITNTDRL